MWSCRRCVTCRCMPGSRCRCRSVVAWFAELFVRVADVRGDELRDEALHDRHAAGLSADSVPCRSNDPGGSVAIDHPVWRFRRRIYLDNLPYRDCGDHCVHRAGHQRIARAAFVSALSQCYATITDAHSNATSVSPVCPVWMLVILHLRFNRRPFEWERC